PQGTRDIRARVFDVDGAPLGPTFTANTFTGGSQTTNEVATLSDGTFVIVWRSNGDAGLGQGEDIRGQRFSASGEPLGEEFRIHRDASGDQTRPSITPLADGGFLVGWRNVVDGVMTAMAQRMAADGTRLGDAFAVSTTSAGTAYDPVGTLLSNGDVVITFVQQDRDGAQGGIFARHFRFDPVALNVTIDATAPDAPTIDLAAVSDTGEDDGDRLTSDTTPTLTGAAEPGATVEILLDGEVVGSVTAGPDGTWSWTSGALADGTYL